MSEVDRALAQISDIRAQLASSTRFRGFAPETLVVIAAMSFVVSVAQAIWPDVLATDNIRYIMVWGGVLLASTVAVGVEAVARARLRHHGMAQPMLGAARRMVLPYAFVGLVIALALCRYAPEAAWAVPGIWLLLTALIAFASHGILPRAILWLGVWYFLTGTAVLFMAGESGTLFSWMMGVPHVLGNLGVAWLLHRAEGSARDG